MIYQSVSELVGRTPLLHAARYCDAYAEGANILCKLEYFNPAGSAKDRVALSMIEDAEAKGIISPEKGTVIIEPTSGNTGIGLASICASRVLSQSIGPSMRRWKGLAMRPSSSI